jgi:hypothetical protein
MSIADGVERDRLREKRLADVPGALSGSAWIAGLPRTSVTDCAITGGDLRRCRR